jgi:hypothetical protein
MRLGLGLSISKNNGKFSGVGNAFVSAFKARVLGDSGTFEGESFLTAIANILASYWASFTLFTTANAFKTSKLYSIIPTSGAGDMAYTRSSTATRINQNGLIETMAANVPRIDWTYGYPVMLSETVSTNNCLRSEDLTNANWVKSSGGNLATVTGNTTVAPDGNTTADTITFSGTLGSSFVAQSIGALSVVSGNRVTISVFARTSTQIIVHGGGGAPGTDGAYQIQAIGNGWFRQSITRTYSGSGNPQIVIVNTFVGNGSFQVWGAQAETGAHPTSYIPTVASVVSRTADSSNTTGLSSLIGQSEGTIYAEILVTQITADYLICALTLTGQSVTNAVIFSVNSIGRLVAQIFASSVLVVNTVNTPFVVGTLYKVAFGYKSGDTVVFVNGTQVGTTDTDVFTLTTLNAVSLVNSGYYVGGGQQAVKSIGLFPTRLSNSQLATLTT